MEKKSIGNVNVLDLRKATEASIAEVARIGNVNVAIVAPETAGLLARLAIGNLNASVEQPAGVQIKTTTGQVFINHSYFANLEAQVFPLVIGQMIFEPEVTAEDIQKGMSGFIAIGQVICPEPLLGVVQAKAEKLIGQTKTYPLMQQVLFNSLTLDEKTLASMADGSEIAVIGEVTLPEVISNDLLAQKIGRLFVSGEVKCHDENAPFFRTHLVKGSGSVKTIPAGFEWVEGDLHFDSNMLETWTAKKLYCTGRVIFDVDVTPAVLDEHLAGMTGEGAVFAPQALRSVLSHKVDGSKTKVTYYEGELWLVDDERSLPASRFDYLEGKATLLVEGVLSIAAEVDPKILAERLAKVHNFGVIHCTSAQMGALQARLGIHEGVIDCPAQVEEKEENPNVIGNANYLAL